MESAIALFWENFWVKWNEPTKPENLLAIVRTVVGSEEEAQKVVASTKSDEVKKLLAGNTDKAFKDGAFGLPWFVGKCSSYEKCDSGYPQFCKAQWRSKRKSTD